MASQRQWERRRLDRRHVPVAQLLEILQHGVRQPERRERRPGAGIWRS